MYQELLADDSLKNKHFRKLLRKKEITKITKVINTNFSIVTSKKPFKVYIKFYK